MRVECKVSRYTNWTQVVGHETYAPFYYLDMEKTADELWHQYQAEVAMLERFGQKNVISFEEWLNIKGFCKNNTRLVMKYIDTEKLNSLIDNKLEDLGMSGSVWVGRSVLCELKDEIKSLQQEQPEIDDIKREWYNKGYLKGRQEAHIPARELGLPKALDFKPLDEDLERDAVSFCYDNGLNTTPHIAKTIAKHFYELGLNTKE